MELRHAVTFTGEKAPRAGVRLSVPFVDLKAQYSFISKEVDSSLKDVLSSCDFILGEKVKRFEKEFASYCGTGFATGVASGTDALHLALRALGIGPGDEVITQANTFIATVLAISYTGATPVLVDIDQDTYNISLSGIEAAITPNTRAIMPVHIYGRCAPMDEIRAIAAKYGLRVIEDACQAHGAVYYGKDGARRAGSLGDISAFSFYPGKNLGAYGDGGAVVTDSSELNDKVRMLRDYGQPAKYSHTVKGYNSRLDTIQAAVLLAKLSRLDEWNTLRAGHARRYIELLADVPEVKLPDFEEEKGLSHVFHLFVIRAVERDALRDYLSNHSISTGIHYPVPTHLQEAFSDLGMRENDLPETEKASKEILSLPMFPELRDEQITYVTETIKEFYGR